MAKIPKTRPVSFVIHETMFEPMRKLAELKANGSVSELIMLILYTQLIKEGIVKTDEIRELLG